MKPYLSYLIYVIRHKWFVFLECCKLGIFWMGIVHDWSKLLPAEWFPYARAFYTDDSVDAQFDRAWLDHLHRNKHHSQHWVLIQDEDENKVLPMPDRYRRELLADWRGGWKASPQGFVPPLVYYKANKDKIKFHPTTRAWIERMLGYETE